MKEKIRELLNQFSQPGGNCWKPFIMEEDYEQLSIRLESLVMRGVSSADEICEKVKRSPLGLKPKYIHDEQRFDEIRNAIMSYISAGEKIKGDWLDEYHELQSKFSA